jgi:hypothetical protein
MNDSAWDLSDAVALAVGAPFVALMGVAQAASDGDVLTLLRDAGVSADMLFGAFVIGEIAEGSPGLTLLLAFVLWLRHGAPFPKVPELHVRWIGSPPESHPHPHPQALRGHDHDAGVDVDGGE